MNFSNTEDGQKIVEDIFTNLGLGMRAGLILCADKCYQAGQESKKTIILEKGMKEIIFKDELEKARQKGLKEGQESCNCKGDLLRCEHYKAGLKDGHEPWTGEVLREALKKKEVK